MLYRFNLMELGDTILDEEGLNFPNLAAARGFAITAARDVIAADVLRGVLTLDHSIEITDSGGEALTTVSFAEAVILRVHP